MRILFEMPHIHTEPGQHDITASAFIILLGGDEPKLLFHEHRVLSKLLQYGGHVELTESPWDAVLREIWEESGYAPEQLQVLQPIPHLTDVGGQSVDPLPACVSTHPFGTLTNHLLTDLAYAFITYEQPSHKVRKGESGIHIQLTRSQLEQFETPGRMPVNVQKIALFTLTLIGTWQPVELREYRK